MFDSIEPRTKKQKPEAKKEVKADGPKAYLAAKGHSFPIFYKGSIIRIGDTEPIEIDARLLGYDSRAQFKSALDKKHILEVGA